MTAVAPRLFALVLCALPPIRAAESAAAKPPAAPPVPTEIVSGAAEAVSTEKETTFTFSNGVTVTGTNLRMTCRELVVVALRSGDAAATLGKQENFKSLVATGGVRIVQNDREAMAEKAEIFPGEDMVVLSGNPVIRGTKDQWEQSGAGQRLILYRGQRRAVFAGPEGTRNRLLLPPLKDLGYDKEKEKPKPGEAAPAAAASPASPAPETPAPVITLPIANPPK